MKTVINILNSFWIGAAAFGVAGVILGVMGHPVFAGACLGAGATKFISAVKKSMK